MGPKPLYVATVSFSHKNDSLPYSHIEVWVNRELPISKQNKIKKQAANDFISRVMAARDIVGLKGDYASVCLWQCVESWQCFSKTRVTLHPHMHPISQENTDESFSAGEAQLLDNTLVLKDIALSNFRIA